ncbi:hypothetical protein MNB_SV-13-423 [hydrothermal vent metagenome]|uniref:Lcl C-terminal domain-containing protein n=1 Tax=hydrothermal vent metagenome TaxID=652676 RepID=A0A1W1BIF0_9ZZZZ
MKHKAIILSLFLSSTFILGGGDIGGEAEVISTVPSISTSSSTSTPSLPDIEIIDSISDPDDLVYKERSTGLIWQDQAYTEDENTAFKQERSYQKAGNFAHATQYCEGLDYAGYVDWRLPTSDELVHIYYHNSRVFTHTKEHDFWSSTASTRNKYYVIYPTDSLRYARSPRQSNMIRCVRKPLD